MIMPKFCRDLTVKWITVQPQMYNLRCTTSDAHYNLHLGSSFTKNKEQAELRSGGS